MGTPQAIVWMVIGCTLFVVLLFFHKLFLKLLSLLFKGALGGLGFMLVNTLFGMAGLSLGVGINAISVLVVALLGIPGFILLYATQFILS
jgi:hypothetical protein